MTRIALVLALLLSIAMGSAPVAGQTPSGAGVSVEEAMPYLGHTVRLPASWERVVGDSTTPVPSIGSIADRDQVTAQALAAAADYIAAAGGALDPMGLCAAHPHHRRQPRGP